MKPNDSRSMIVVPNYLIIKLLDEKKLIIALFNVIIVLLGHFNRGLRVS